MRLLVVSVLGTLALGVSAVSPGNAQSTEPDLAARGKREFIRCASCHAIGETGSRIGPNLGGVVGRKAGGLAGYTYSPAMAKQDFVWNEATLDAWLTHPQTVVPGTSMAFAGLPKAADRAAITAYLKRPQ